MGAVARRLFEEAFQDEVLVQVEANPETRSWSAAGRGRLKRNPAGEDGFWWRQNGPEFVQAWIDWRFESGWKVWSTPDGQSAIELDLIVDCPNGDDVIPVKTIIDRVMVMADGELCILDLKSGSRTPDSDLQLAFYRYALLKHYGVDIKYGTYWMARKGVPVEPFELQRYSVHLMETVFRRFVETRNGGYFLPYPSAKCRACSVNRYCAFFGGAMSHLDPDHEDYGKAEAEPVEVNPVVEENTGEDVSV